MNYNFPEGGWPGDSMRAHDALHFVAPRTGNTMYNLGVILI
jgi:hypothetical protein